MLSSLIWQQCSERATHPAEYPLWRSTRAHTCETRPHAAITVHKHHLLKSIRSQPPCNSRREGRIPLPGQTCSACHQGTQTGNAGNTEQTIAVLEGRGTVSQQPLSYKDREPPPLRDSIQPHSFWPTKLPAKKIQSGTSTSPETPKHYLSKAKWTNGWSTKYI